MRQDSINYQVNFSEISLGDVLKKKHCHAMMSKIITGCNDNIT